MPFVVKAVFTAGEIRWLTRPKLAGERTFSTLKDAQAFGTPEEAQIAVGEMWAGNESHDVLSHSL